MNVYSIFGFYFQGVWHKSTEDLASILVKADGHLHMVKPYGDTNFDSIDLNSNEYSTNLLKTMLLDLLNIIDNIQNSSPVSPIPSGSSVTQTSTSPQISTNSTQNNNIIPNESLQSNIDKPITTKSEKQMTPDVTLNTHHDNTNNIISSELSEQNTIGKPTAIISEKQRSPGITPNTFCQVYYKNNIISSEPPVKTNIFDVSQSYINYKKMDEKALALRRLYKNKYRYLYITNNSQTIGNKCKEDKEAFRSKSTNKFMNGTKNEQTKTNTVNNVTKTTENYIKQNVIDQNHKKDNHELVLQNNHSLIKNILEESSCVLLKKYTPPNQNLTQKGKK